MGVFIVKDSGLIDTAFHVSSFCRVYRSTPPLCEDGVIGVRAMHCHVAKGITLQRVHSKFFAKEGHDNNIYLVVY